MLFINATDPEHLLDADQRVKWVVAEVQRQRDEGLMAGSDELNKMTPEQQIIWLKYNRSQQRAKATDEVIAKKLAGSNLPYSDLT